MSGDIFFFTILLHSFGEPDSPFLGTDRSKKGTVGLPKAPPGSKKALSSSKKDRNE